MLYLARKDICRIISILTSIIFPHLINALFPNTKIFSHENKNNTLSRRNSQ
jgi:hypothetical protein